MTSYGDFDRIMFAPEDSFASVGDTVSINIAIDVGVVGLFAYTVHIKYDSTILDIIDAYPTSQWLSISGTSQYFVASDSLEYNPDTNDSNWYFHVFDVLFTNPKSTISGYAEIATLEFEVKQPGISTVWYQFYKGTDTLLNSIIGSSANATVYVCPFAHTPGDLNGDSEVDIADLVYFVTFSFNSGPEPVPSLFAADLNCDTEVDIADIVYMVTYMFSGGPSPCDPCQ